MTGSTEPTLGEVMRRLDEVVKHLVFVTERQERRDAYVDENFVRASVWLEARKADQAMVTNLHQDIGALQEKRESDAKFRRQMLLAFAIAAGGWLLTAVIYVGTLLTSRFS